MSKSTIRTRIFEKGNSGSGSGSGVQSVVGGTNITIDNTDPQNPIINSSGDDIIVVTNYSALPNPTTVSGKFYWVSSEQGTSWLPGSLGGTYYNSGLYYSNGTTWEFLNVPYQATQATVNTGTNNDQFVTSNTLTNATVITNKELLANKDVSNGYVGKTLQRINFIDNANTFISYFENDNAASRTYTFQNKTGIIAHLDDLIKSHFFQFISQTPADATNYYFGPWGNAPGTTDTFRAFKFAEARRIINGTFQLIQSTNSTGETSTLYLRNVSSGTNQLIGTFTSDFGASTGSGFFFSGLNLLVNSTDKYTILLLTPTFVTNPSGWLGALTLTSTSV